VKKIKKISYPSKYDELIQLYGDDEGYLKYMKFLRGVSLEKYILKYGKENGQLKYNEYKLKMKNSGVTIEKMINKYGEIKGNIKYKEWKQNTRQDLDGFIRRYGEDIGQIKYNSFRSKSIKSLENINRENIKTPRQLEYWIKKCGGDVDNAKQELSKFQNRGSLEYFVRKYGEETGKIIYTEVNVKKTITLKSMITLYGEVKGKEKYDNWRRNVKNSNQNLKKRYIEKHGEKIGILLYKELIKKRTRQLNRYSNIAIEFCEKIISNLNGKYKNIYYGDNEYKFYVWEDNMNILSPDLYIKDINLVIEFYGDFWHKNPLLYNDKQEFVKEIWKHDIKRIEKIKTKYNCDVIIIWEYEYNHNKKETINKVIKKIKDKYGNS